MTTICNLLRIFQRLQGIREQLRHLFRRFYIVLPAFITHTVFVIQLLSSLNTQQNIMGICVLCISVMYIIGGYQLNSCFFAHTQKLLIYHFLFWYAMILQFQKIVSFSKNLFMLQCRFFCLFIQPPGQILLYLTGQAGT